MHKSAPSGPQAVSLRFLHHRVHCHRWTFHEGVLREAWNRVGIGAHFGLSICICIRAVPCIADIPSSAFFCESAPFVVVCSRVEPTPKPRPRLGPFSSVVAVPPRIMPIPCSISGPPDNSPPVASSGQLWKTSDSSCGAACGSGAIQLPGLLATNSTTRALRNPTSTVLFGPHCGFRLTPALRYLL